MQVERFRNSLLASFSSDIIERLSLQPIRFEVEHEIEFPGNPIRQIFFLEEGMASVTATFQDGSQVEVGTFGVESVIGVSGLMGARRSLNRIYTQIAGRGFCCTLSAARKEFALGGLFQATLLAYVQAQLVQTMQSVGCNAKHTVEQRLARWMLTCADRADKKDFLMSHQFLSQMLGSSRPTVSIAAAILKEEGLIEYTRGFVHILDTPGLEFRACECYLTIKRHLASQVEFDHGLLSGAAVPKIA